MHAFRSEYCCRWSTWQHRLKPELTNLPSVFGSQQFEIVALSTRLGPYFNYNCAIWVNWYPWCSDALFSWYFVRPLELLLSTSSWSRLLWKQMPCLNISIFQIKSYFYVFKQLGVYPVINKLRTKIKALIPFEWILKVNK